MEIELLDPLRRAKLFAKIFPRAATFLPELWTNCGVIFEDYVHLHTRSRRGEIITSSVRKPRSEFPADGKVRIDHTDFRAEVVHAKDCEMCLQNKEQLLTLQTQQLTESEKLVAQRRHIFQKVCLTEVESWKEVTHSSREQWETWLKEALSAIETLQSDNKDIKQKLDSKCGKYPEPTFRGGFRRYISVRQDHQRLVDAMGRNPSDALAQELRDVETFLLEWEQWSTSMKGMEMALNRDIDSNLRHIQEWYRRAWCLKHLLGETLLPEQIEQIDAERGKAYAASLEEVQSVQKWAKGNFGDWVSWIREHQFLLCYPHLPYDQLRTTTECRKVCSGWTVQIECPSLNVVVFPQPTLDDEFMKLFHVVKKHQADHYYLKLATWVLWCQTCTVTQATEEQVKQLFATISCIVIVGDL